MDTTKKTNNECFGDPSECKGKMTKEHVISKSILEIFGPLEFQTNNKKVKLGKKTYVIRNLCEHHNQLLSKYDNEALKLFCGWHRLITNSEAKHPEAKKNTVCIDIEKIEKWYAKTFLNSIAFRHKALNPKDLLLPLPIHSIRKKIFGEEPFEPPFGIYMIDPKNPLIQNKREHSMGPQFQSGHFIHKGKMKAVKTPTLYYTRLHGIELVGFFNLTGLDDEQALDSVLNSWKVKLEKCGIYREKINFATSHKSDENFNGKVPTRFIQFGGTKFKDLLEEDK